VAESLGREGFEPTVVDNGSYALAAAQAQPPDLVLLDLVLPGRSGLDVCRDFRAHPTLGQVPVIILTGLADETDRIVGLELGADDYIAKPFSARELVLRVKAVLRRMHALPAADVRVVGSLRIDVPRRSVTLQGVPLQLTAKEFDLLLALVDARGRVLSREHLLRSVWGFEHAAEQRTRTVDVHVLYLRRKLGPEAGRLETFKGVGYRLNVEPAAATTSTPTTA
jgi:DNA-binding response OmpR family regulator